MTGHVYPQMMQCAVRTLLAVVPNGVVVVLLGEQQQSYDGCGPMCQGVGLQRQWVPGKLRRVLATLATAPDCQCPDPE